MSCHIIPKEHRIRKPKSAFERSKKLHMDDLYDSKSSTKRSIYRLDKKVLAKSKKRQNRKILFEVIFFIAVVIPLALKSIQLFLNYINAVLG